MFVIIIYFCFYWCYYCYSFPQSLITDGSFNDLYKPLKCILSYSRNVSMALIPLLSFYYYYYCNYYYCFFYFYFIMISCQGFEGLYSCRRSDIAYDVISCMVRMQVCLSVYLIIFFSSFICSFLRIPLNIVTC